jgi:hypothetical protein
MEVPNRQVGKTPLNNSSSSIADDENARPTSKTTPVEPLVVQPAAAPEIHRPIPSIAGSAQARDGVHRAILFSRIITR